MRSTECGVRSAEYGMRSTEYGVLLFYAKRSKNLDPAFSTEPVGSVDNLESIINVVANARQSN